MIGHKRKFNLGRLVATPGALEALKAAHTAAIVLVARHATGDWGDLCDEDKQENEFAVKNGERILSAYNLPTGKRIWIITEADRSATTLLLPDEY